MIQKPSQANLALATDDALEWQTDQLKRDETSKQTIEGKRAGV
jgi:hypothetical protein